MFFFSVLFIGACGCLLVQTFSAILFSHMANDFEDEITSKTATGKESDPCKARDERMCVLVCFVDVCR